MKPGHREVLLGWEFLPLGLFLVVLALVVGYAVTGLEPPQERVVAPPCGAGSPAAVYEQLMRYPDEYEGDCFNFTGQALRREPAYLGFIVVVDTEGPVPNQQAWVLVLGGDACFVSGKGRVLPGDGVSFTGKFRSIWGVTDHERGYVETPYVVCRSPNPVASGSERPEPLPDFGFKVDE